MLNFVALHNVYEAALSLKENGEKADLDLAIEYFENAKTEFKHALELSKADLLWLGFSVSMLPERSSYCFC